MVKSYLITPTNSDEREKYLSIFRKNTVSLDTDIGSIFEFETALFNLKTKSTSALLVAAHYSFISVASTLLQHGAYVDISVNSVTPISLAIINRNKDLTLLFMRYGATKPWFNRYGEKSTEYIKFYDECTAELELEKISQNNTITWITSNETTRRNSIFQSPNFSESKQILYKSDGVQPMTKTRVLIDKKGSISNSDEAEARSPTPARRRCCSIL